MIRKLEGHLRGTFANARIVAGGPVANDVVNRLFSADQRFYHRDS